MTPPPVLDECAAKARHAETARHNRTTGRRPACVVRGCCWRGSCPVHDVDEPRLRLASLVMERPFGRGWAA